VLLPLRPDTDTLITEIRATASSPLAVQTEAREMAPSSFDTYVQH
jgi:hypothetical protein